MPQLLSDRAVTVSPLALTTTAEARMLGIPLSNATWVRVRKGVYADRHAFAALPPWGKYAVRVHAFARKHPDAVRSHESAAVIHGLPLFGETRDIHVFDPNRAASRRFGDVLVHTSIDHREMHFVRGTAVTGLLDTVVDLARVLPPAQALSVLDAAVSPAQGGPLTLSAVRERADAQSSTRGRAPPALAVDARRRARRVPRVRSPSAAFLATLGRRPREKPRAA